jgi:hypothetical protein
MGAGRGTIVRLDGVAHVDAFHDRREEGDPAWRRNPP